MRIVYSLAARQPVEVTNLLPPSTIGGVDVEWDLNGDRIIGLRLIMRGRLMRRDATSGRVVVRNANDDRDAFRVASYLTDTILALSGIDAFQPEEVFTQSPQADPEDPEEETTISQAGTTNHLAVGAKVVLSRTLQSGRLPGKFADSRAIESYAQGMRADHPFDQFTEYFKVVEFCVPPLPNGKDRVREKFDKWVHDYVVSIDSTFDEGRVKALRILRDRITHPKAYYGPLSRHNTSDIEQLEAEVPDIKRLATIMIWRTPTPWM